MYICVKCLHFCFGIQQHGNVKLHVHICSHYKLPPGFTFKCSVKKEDIKEAIHLGVDQEVFAIDDGCEKTHALEPGELLEMDATKLLEQACCIAYEACLKALAITHVPGLEMWWNFQLCFQQDWHSFVP